MIGVRTSTLQARPREFAWEKAVLILISKTTPMPFWPTVLSRRTLLRRQSFESRGADFLLENLAARLGDYRETCCSVDVEEVRSALRFPVSQISFNPADELMVASPVCVCSDLKRWSRHKSRRTSAIADRTRGNADCVLRAYHNIHARVLRVARCKRSRRSYQSRDDSETNIQN